MEDCNMDGTLTIRRTAIAQAVVVLVAILMGVCEVMGASGNDVVDEACQADHWSDRDADRD